MNLSETMLGALFLVYVNTILAEEDAPRVKNRMVDQTYWALLRRGLIEDKNKITITEKGINTLRSYHPDLDERADKWILPRIYDRDVNRWIARNEKEAREKIEAVLDRFEWSKKSLNVSIHDGGYYMAAWSTPVRRVSSTEIVLDNRADEFNKALEAAKEIHAILEGAINAPGRPDRDDYK